MPLLPLLLRTLHQGLPFGFPAKSTSSGSAGHRFSDPFRLLLFEAPGPIGRREIVGVRQAGKDSKGGEVAPLQRWMIAIGIQRHTAVNSKEPLTRAACK